MAKTRPSLPSKSSQKKQRKSTLHGTLPSHSSKNLKPQAALDPNALLTQATALLQTGQAPSALPLAQKALASLPQNTAASLPALLVLGQIQIELGDPASALKSFSAAADIDPEGTVPESEGGGAEKFLWLAQLCEEGGEESIQWFQRACAVLEGEIAALQEQDADIADELEEKRRKLAGALCGMIEVWMTDLSFDPAAEAQCESLIARALLLSPTPHATTLQTLASIRLSQARLAEAQSALTRSLATWQQLPAEHADVPDHATRISLARLLMEAHMYGPALDVLERLVGEDDESVEAWYLGGWCLYLMAEASDADGDDESMQEKDTDDDDEGDDEKRVLLLSSREWLRNSLKLYELLQYEDARLGEHARELIAALDAELGDEEIEDGDSDYLEWESDENGDEDGDKDGDDFHEMNSD